MWSASPTRSSAQPALRRLLWDRRPQLARDPWKGRSAAGRGPGPVGGLAAWRWSVRPGLAWNLARSDPGRDPAFPSGGWPEPNLASQRSGGTWPRAPSCRTWDRGRRRRSAPRAWSRQNRARRPAGRAGSRWPGRSGDPATSRLRRRHRVGWPHREHRAPAGSGPEPQRPDPAAASSDPGRSRRPPAPPPRSGRHRPKRDLAPPVWSDPTPTRRLPAHPTKPRPPGRVRHLARPTGPARRPRPDPPLALASPHWQREHPPPPQDLLPAPSRPRDPDPWRRDPAPPLPDLPGSAPRWRRGWGRW